MYSTYFTIALAILCLDSTILVRAGLFIVQPAAGSVCKAGQECTISWVDDGLRPLVSAIGVSTVGLYTGRQQLVQSITPVDVSTEHSITFQPNPAAGPDSDSYYISLISTTFQGNDSIPYAAYSPFFTLTGMSGSYASPLPAATSSISIPAFLTSSSSTSSPATITVGTLSTAVNTLGTSVPPASASTTRSRSSSSSRSSSRSSSSSSTRFSTVISPSLTPTQSPSPSPLTSASQSSNLTASSSSLSSLFSPAPPLPTTTQAQTSSSVGRSSNFPTFLPTVILAFVITHFL